MKTRILNTARLSLPLASAIAALLAAPTASAATYYYWDNNGATAGFGTAAGTWAAPTIGDDTQGWSTSNAGTAVPGASITTLSTNATTDAINFGYTTTGLAAGTINVSGTVNSGNITFAAGSGAIELSGGVINLPTAGATITVNNATNTIGSDFTGAATSTTNALVKAGAGVLRLSGNNTFTGRTVVSGGVLLLDSATAVPGGIGTTGGIGPMNLSNGGVLGLGAGDFTRTMGANGLVGGVYFTSNGGWAAYGADRVVNLGGADVQTTWFNGKTLILGTSTSTHKVNVRNRLNITTVTRPLLVNDGLGAVDGELSGVISHNAGAFAGVDKTGAGTVAFTGASTFEGSLVVRAGTVIANSVTNTGTPSSIGRGTSGFTLAGGTFQYAPVSGAGGGAATINRNFGIAASSSLDASGTGALFLNNTNVISPDDSGQTGTWIVGANKTVTGLTSTANLAIGMLVSGAGIPAGATITQILSSSSVSMSGTTTAAGSGTPITFGYPSARTLTLTGTNTDANTLAGILQDSSSISLGVLSLTKAGSGNWVLSGANTFTGATTVTDGTLTLAGSGAVNNSSGITVNAPGAKLVQASSVAITPPVTLTQGTLTGSGTVNTVNVGAGTGGIISNNNGVAGAALTIGALTFDGAATVNTFSNSPSAPIATTTLATNAAGTVTINASSLGWVDNTSHELISYGGGSVGGPGSTQFVLGTVSGLSARQVASTLGDSGSAITLTITGDTPYWTGDGDGKWNTGSANNWKLVSDNSLAVFLVNDNALFNDSATGVGPIAVDIDLANVAPNSTVFNNSGKDYVLGSTGGFGISSGSLVKNGTGTLTINNANTYAGGTNVSAGTLTLGNTNAIGTGLLTLNGGNLDSSVANLVNAGNNAQLWNSDFTFVGTESLNLGTGPVTLGGNRTVTVSANNLTVGGSIGGGAVDLIKLGAGTLTLAGGGTFTGTLMLNAGNLALSPATAGPFSMSNALSGAGTLNANPFAADGSDLTLGGDLSGFIGTVNVATSGGFDSKLATTGASSSFGAGTIVNIANGGTWASAVNQTGITVNIFGLGNSGNIGALRLDAGTLDSTSSVVLKADASIGGTGSATINAPISEDGGSFGFTKQGTGTLFLGGTNSYSGLTTVSTGVLVLQNPAALGTTAGGTSAADGTRVELDNLTVTGEAIMIAGTGGDNLGALRSRSGNSVWNGPVTVDADLTRIGAITGATFEVSGAIDDGANDYRIRFRPNSATATIIVSGANTYTGGTSIFGGTVVASSLNSVVGGTASSSFGAPVTEANGIIILGIAGSANNGTLSYIGAGETTDRTFQLGDNSATPATGDNGAGAIENNGTAGPLVFSAPVFNTPTNNTVNASAPTRVLTLGGTNTGANTISGVIQNNQVAGAPTAPVAVAKNGIGTWVLAGANTYTGTTTVSDGTLELATTGQLKFVLGATSGVNNSLTGAGTATLNGTFVIDTSAADALSTGSWTLESVDTLTGAYGSTFSVAGFTDAGSDKWTKVAGTNLYTFDETTGVLTLALAGYAEWSGGAPFDADANGDGVENGLAWLLGAANPNANAVGLLPTVTQSGNNLVLKFNCLNAAKRAGATLNVEHSSDLGLTDPWEAALMPESDGTVNDLVFDITAGDPLNAVEVTIPASKASGGKLFGRLNGVNTP